MKQLRQIIDIKNDLLCARLSYDDRELEDVFASLESYDGLQWRNVSIPHDIAIEGDFDVNNDIELDETGAVKTSGTSGGLPIVGIGVYKKQMLIGEEYSEQNVFLEFDGIMNESAVFVNGRLAGKNHYGYLSFSLDVTELVSFGALNEICVLCRVRPLSSRWYSGLGIFRPARMLICNKTHLAYTGVRIEPELCDNGSADVRVRAEYTGNVSRILAAIIDSDGNAVAEDSFESGSFSMSLASPELWSIDTPSLYTLKLTLIGETGEALDSSCYSFGVRKTEFIPDKGFFLNGKYTKLKGACMHHDLGLLGAAYNESAARRQLEKLREMGCNALRTTHNPPAPQLLRLCDEMGFVVIVEFFDEWKIPKRTNGYNIYFEQHAEQDVRSVIRRDANHPCIIMWSIGNEIPEQTKDHGKEISKLLTDVCHSEDSFHPVTVATNLPTFAMRNGFVEPVDIVGLNYKPRSYAMFHKDFPNYVLYGSETESTLSSRGEYKIPPVYEYDRVTRDDLTVNSYEMSTNRTYTAEREFAYQDLLPYVLGQFTWTGFDYLGEPEPYRTQWPSRSAYFGIFDLAGIPKDRYWLFKSQWSGENVLHVFPHWNWDGREGKNVPVHCFTSFESAELFVNGVSQGVQRRYYGFEHEIEQYRLIWKDVVYQPGELKVVAYNPDGSVAMEDVRVTAGAPARIVLTPEKPCLSANTEDVLFIGVSAVDENGNFCPLADNDISFTAEGAVIRGTDNGDQRDVRGLTKPYRKLYNGRCVVAISSDGSGKPVTLKATSNGLAAAELELCLKA